MQPTTADRKYDDFAGELTDAQIATHISGRAAYAVPYAQDGLASMLTFDIDQGGRAALRTLLHEAETRGLWAFGQHDHSRDRGYVWIPFDDLVNVARLHTLGEEMITAVMRNGWKIENRATHEDTRLPFARHAWSRVFGWLYLPDPTGGTRQQRTPIDPYPADAFNDLITVYRENPTERLPPAPEPEPTPQRTRATHDLSTNAGVTIASYNAATDLVNLLESYGARRARGQGRSRLYFCPFHSDNHASLLIHRDGERCHCLSRGSDCPLADRQHDAFNVYCTGERLTPYQALRRLNGLPDDPEPGNGGASPQTRPRTPPTAPGRTNATQAYRQTQPATPTTLWEHPQNALSAASQQDETPNRRAAALRPVQPRTEASEQPRTAHPCPKLPKSARRILDYLRQQPDDYYRGKYHLAQTLDLDPRTVQRALRILETHELITRYERGRGGQTDIYKVIRGGATNRVSTSPKPPHESTDPPSDPAPLGETVTPGGATFAAHMNHESCTHDNAVDSAGKGGRLPAPRPGAPPQAEDDGRRCGPAGAVAYPGGAAYVPPEAEAWYMALPDEYRPRPPAPPSVDQAPQDATVEAVPLPFAPTGGSIPVIEAPPAGAVPKKRRRARNAAPLDPGRVRGRIIAAERKAAKLEATGRLKDKAQARAIRRAVERLKYRLAAQQERQYSAEACDEWQPPITASAPAAPAGDAGDVPCVAAPPVVTSTAPQPAPLTSSPAGGVRWEYLECMYRTGNLEAIERHCFLQRADVVSVLGRLRCDSG
jgi:DNA-binding transcriptional ArsR family regulator/nitrogen fixation protein